MLQGGIKEQVFSLHTVNCVKMDFKVLLFLSVCLVVVGAQDIDDGGCPAKPRSKQSSYL